MAKGLDKLDGVRGDGKEHERERKRAQAQVSALTAAPGGQMMLFFFGDESASWLSRAEQRSSLVPFGSKANAREVCPLFFMYI